MDFNHSKTALSPDTRITYLDALRGIAILLMVTGHAFVFLVRNEPNAINDFVITWSMPLFAAISGFVSFRETITTPAANAKVKRRLTQQILPTLILCTIWTSTLSPATWQETIDSMYKGGYWYTFVALELYLIYLAILLTVRGMTNSRKIQSIIFIAIIIGTPILEKWLFTLGISPSCRWLVPNLLKLLPPFFLGCLLRANERTMARLVSHKLPMAALITALLTVCALILHMGLYDHHSVYIRFLSSLCPTVAFLFLFLTFGNTFETSRIASLLSRYGKDSLEIYLLYFFILASLGYFVDLYVFSDSMPDLLMYIILLAVAIPVASLCLIFTKFLCRVDIYRYIFFTDKPLATIAKQERT